MKFYNFINEASRLTAYDIANLIKKDCSEYLNNNKGIVLYSGRDRENLKFLDKQIRKDRRPLTTNRKLHLLMDNIFKSIFNIKLRSETLFCTLDIDVAEGFGNVYVIFPKNGYNFYWSEKIGDFTEDISSGRLLSDGLENNDYGILALHWWYNTLKHLNYNYDTYFQDAIEMINSKGMNHTNIIDKIQNNYEILTLNYIKNIYNKSKSLNNMKNKYNEIMLHGDEYYAVSMSFYNKEIKSKLK